MNSFNAVAAGEIGLAFWYEYARESESIRSLVASIRADPYNRVAHKRHPFFRLGCWLANIPSWPRIGWADLSEAERLGAMIIEVPIPKPVAIMFGPIRRAPYETDFVIRVDWRASDRAIECALQNGMLDLLLRVIRRKRPPRFADRAKRYPAQRAFDGQRLPFRKRAALDWLDMFRLHQDRKRWREFCRARPESVRVMLKSVAQARAIIAWLDGKAKLTKADFV